MSFQASANSDDSNFELSSPKLTTSLRFAGFWRIKPVVELKKNTDTVYSSESDLKAADSLPQKVTSFRSHLGG